MAYTLSSQNKILLNVFLIFFGLWEACPNKFIALTMYYYFFIYLYYTFRMFIRFVHSRVFSCFDYSYFFIIDFILKLALAGMFVSIRCWICHSILLLTYDFFNKNTNYCYIVLLFLLLFFIFFLIDFVIFCYYL